MRWSETVTVIAAAFHSLMAVIKVDMAGGMCSGRDQAELEAGHRQQAEGQDREGDHGVEEAEAPLGGG